MMNVLRIFKRDLLRLLHAPAALVVVLVLAILPSVYTWYNVVGFWDPYENTGDLKVSVVNLDRGGETELTGRMDVGEQITQQLRSDHRLDWQFSTYDEAMDALNRGEVYAAFVIPEDFTAQLLTLTTGDFQQPKIRYYVNEKAGPVAPKITDTGATTLEETVNSTFVSTVSDVAVQAVDEALGRSHEEMARIRSEAAARADEASQALAEARAGLAGSADDARAAAGRMGDLEQKAVSAQGQIDEAAALLEDVSDLSGSLAEDVAQLNAQATPAISSALVAVSQASAKANALVGSISGAVSGAQGTLDAAISQGEAMEAQNEALIAYLRQTADGLPSTDPAKQQLNAAADALETQNQNLANTLDSLKAASGSAAAANASLTQAADAMNSAVQNATDAAGSIWDDAAGALIPEAVTLLEQVSQAASGLSGSISAAKATVDEGLTVAKQLRGALEGTAEALEQTDGLLASLEEAFAGLSTDINALSNAHGLEEFLGVDELNAQKIAAFMGSPTEVETVELYPLNAYGSAMAPLFMNLTFWIGAFMLLVIMRQEVDGRGIRNMTIAQSYLGRFLLFALIAALQAIICCAGVLALGVQTANAAALILAAVVASLAYLSIIYALSVTLQHIGKGICIVLVFAQIPGATGLYPIEMTSGFFQTIYPLFPFTYDIGAMREAICGFYGAHYLMDLAVLGLFFAVFMAFGLGVRPHMANVNRMVADQIRQSGLYNGERVEVPARPYRISQILRALADRTEYREAITRRYERFARLYPQLIRGAVVGGIGVPVIISVVFAFTPAEKVWVLTFWLAWLAAIMIFLVAVESLRYSIERQMQLEDMSQESLIGLFANRGRMSGSASGGGDGAEGSGGSAGRGGGSRA